MKSIRAPSGASESLTNALGTADRGVQKSLKNLDPNDRNLFWSELERFAAAQIGHKTNLPLIVGEHIPLLIREALRETESRVANALRRAPGPDRDAFWQAVRDSAAEQTARREPKVRASGGQISF